MTSNDSVETVDNINNVLEGIDKLSELYECVDIFDTIMETLEELLDDSIGLYEDIERLTVYKSQLKRGLISETDVSNQESELQKLESTITEKIDVLKNIINNANEIATNMPLISSN